MLKTKTRLSYLKKALKIKHHGKLYFVNKKKLNFVLGKIGIKDKFNFNKNNLKDFLFENRLLYTEFLQYVSDGIKTFNK